MLQNIIKPDRPEMFSFRLSVQSLCNEKTNESKGSLHDQTGTSLFFSLIVCHSVEKRAQHVTPNNVTLCCIDMMRSFGQGLMLVTLTYRFHFRMSYFN